LRLTTLSTVLLVYTQAGSSSAPEREGERCCSSVAAPRAASIHTSWEQQRARELCCSSVAALLQLLVLLVYTQAAPSSLQQLSMRLYSSSARISKQLGMHLNSSSARISSSSCNTEPTDPAAAVDASQQQLSTHLKQLAAAEHASACSSACISTIYTHIHTYIQCIHTHTCIHIMHA
jgi:hypothetical protein